MQTIILGKRSQLTKRLVKEIPITKVLGSEEINLNNFKKLPKKFNLIINIFYPANRLNNIKKYEDFFKKNFIFLSKFFDNVSADRLNKVIYSSSASVFGVIAKEISSKNLYAISKTLSESYLQSLQNIKKKLIIARIFNIYDDDDKFSIIHKIIENKKNKRNLTIFNGGENIRDFISARDVSKIYKKLLRSNKKGIIEIGTGTGIKIKDILNKINANSGIIYRGNTKEQNISIANIDPIRKLIKNIKFSPLEKFFTNKKIKITRKFSKFFFPNLKTYKNASSVTVIYGAGFSGKKLRDDLIKRSDNFIYFVDDNLKDTKTNYKSSPILSFDDFLSIYKYLNISNVIIAIPSIDFNRRRKIIENLKQITDNILILPPKNEIINNRIDFSDARLLEVNDFFNRKITKINNNLIKYLNKSSVLITGGAGSIGNELVNQISKTNVKKIIIFDKNETELFRVSNPIINKSKIIPILGDINDTEYLKKILIKYKINHVFHAAAYKHVNILEDNFSYAAKNNIQGTLSVLRSLNHKIKTFTLISTDKAAAPKNNLGLTKRSSEIISFYYIRKFLKKTKLSVVRFGNVFGSRGSAIEVFLNQINSGQPITVTHKKAERYFMSIKEACNLVLQSISLKKINNGIFILNMGKPINILKIVKAILKYYDKKNYPINFIGLKKGEKLKELLTISKKIIKTKHPDIFQVVEKKYSDQLVENLINFLDEDVKLNKQKLKKLLKI